MLNATCLPLHQPSVQACASCGCTAGTAAVKTAGAELEPDALQQLCAGIAGILAADQAEAAGQGVLGAAAVAAAAVPVH